MNLLTLTLFLATTVDPVPVVEAAREAKEKRRTSTTKVITNADVRKTKGRLMQTTVAPLAEETAAPPMTLEAYEAAKKDRIAAEHRLAEVEKAIAALESELVAVEARYYAEDDLDRRDGEIRRQFDAARTRLEAAIAERELIAASAGLQMVSPVTVIGAGKSGEPDPPAAAKRPPTP